MSYKKIKPFFLLRCWGTTPYLVWWNISIYQTAGSNDGTGTDGYSFENNATCSNPNIVLNYYGRYFRFLKPNWFVHNAKSMVMVYKFTI